MSQSKQSKLAAALRSRFRTPHDALRALGIGSDVLGAPGGGNSDAAKAMRVEIENLLGELYLDEKQIGRILEVLDKHASFDKLDDDDPNANRARELAGEGDDWLERVKAFCKSKGLSDADIEKALALAKGGAPTVDQPLTAPRGFGGALATDAGAQSFEERHPEVACIGGREIHRRQREIAHDASGFARRHPEVARIGHT
jgi:hypothetical protein